MRPVNTSSFGITPPVMTMLDPVFSSANITYVGSDGMADITATTGESPIDLPQGESSVVTEMALNGGRGRTKPSIDIKTVVYILGIFALPKTAEDMFEKKWAAFKLSPSERAYKDIFQHIETVDTDHDAKAEMISQLWRLLNGEDARRVPLACNFFCDTTRSALNKLFMENKDELISMVSNGNIVSDATDTESDDNMPDGFDSEHFLRPLLPILVEIAKHPPNEEIAKQSRSLLFMVTSGETAILEIKMRGAFASPITNINEGDATYNDTSIEQLIYLISKGRIAENYLPRIKEYVERKMAERVRPAIKDRDTALSDLATSLGHNSYWSYLVKALRIRNPGELLEMIEKVMRVEKRTGRMAEAFKRSWHASHPEAGQFFNMFIPLEKIVPIVTRIYERMGIQFAYPDGRAFKINIAGDNLGLAQLGVQFDGFAFDIDPDDISITLKKQAGLRGLRVGIHEAAHAIHMSRSTEKVGFTDRSADHSMMEGVATLFEGLVYDPFFTKWLVDDVSALDASGKAADSLPTHADLHALVAGGISDDLYSHITQSANALFSAVYFSPQIRENFFRNMREMGNGESAITVGNLYRYFREAADLPVSEYESEHSELLTNPLALNTIPYIRGRLFAATMEMDLRSRFGREWFANKDVGAYLTEKVFSMGNRLNAEEAIMEISGEEIPITAYGAVQSSRIIESGILFLSPHLTADSVSPSLEKEPITFDETTALTPEMFVKLMDILKQASNLDLAKLRSDQLLRKMEDPHLKMALLACLAMFLRPSIVQAGSVGH